MKENVKKQGFTLVELMIAIGIMITLAALSVNGLLRARITASEAAAIRGLRTAQTAFESYKTMNGIYPSTFQQLCQATPPYLDSSWSGVYPTESSKIHDYKYQITFSDANGYEIEAQSSGFNLVFMNVPPRTFYVAEDGVITDGEGIDIGSAAGGVPDKPPTGGDPPEDPPKK